jgi:plastocyanin
MKFSAAAASAAAVIAAFAPSLVSAANITVTVGARKDGTSGLFFDPQQITAQKGDIVNFEFRGGNHTVTQSSFANPCAWQFNTATNQNGFNSGFVPYSNTSGQVGVYSLGVTNADSPIWFFCGRPPHCKNGMYGAINPPTSGNRTFEQFAANVQSTNEPGLGVTVPFTPPGASSSASSGASSSASSSASSAAVPTSSASTPAVQVSGASSSTSNTAAAAAATQSQGAARAVTAGPAVALGFAGLVAGLVL